MAAQNSIKEKASASSFEIDDNDLHLRQQVKMLRIVDTVRTGLTGLALVMGVAILGVSANTLNVYRETHLPSDFLLALWPESFDLRPTTTLVATAAIITLTNIIALVFSKVTVIRNRVPVHTTLTFAAPLIGLIAALVGMSLFYSVNTSQTAETVLSWSCRWRDVSMSERPHFASLCKESWAGVYLAVLLVPVEAAVLAVAGWQLKVESHATAYASARTKSTGSPVVA